jgi:hypothetical protein
VAIAPAPPIEGPIEARETLQADLRRLRGRIDGVEADVRRGDLGLKRETHRLDLDLRREIQRGHLDHTGELAVLKFWSGSHGWLLGVLFVVLIGGIGPAAYWSGTINSTAEDQYRRLDRIEAESARRDKAIDLRLDELKGAIRQANERSIPPR